MFLLTEGTLFFLNLAFNARASREKPSPSDAVQKWINEVAAARDPDTLADSAHTTAGVSSTLLSPPLLTPSYVVDQTPLITDACGVATQSMPRNPSELLADYKGSERVAIIHGNKASVSAPCMNSTSTGKCDRWHHSAPLSRRLPKCSRGKKRKVDDVEVVLDVELDEDNQTTSLEVEIKPSLKKVKAEFTPVPLLSVPDNERYIIEVIKKNSEYTIRDLPIPYDERWSQSFVSTAILWCSVQQDVWHIPKMDLASALQHIFDAVYPRVRYRVTPSGSVFSLVLERIDKWRSGFGSSALAMMLHFFSTLDSADEMRVVAEFLATDSQFLRADPDTCEPTEPFRSPFLLILLAITHLGDVKTCVDVPGWDTRAMAAGEGGDGVIAIASAALERALTFFRDGTLEVDHVLAETARCEDAVVSRTALGAFTGLRASSRLRFSSANWSGRTTAYRDAVRRRGVEFMRGTFDAAWMKRRKIVGDENEDWVSEMGAGTMSAVRGPRALL